jgi:hypothetical protein
MSLCTESGRPAKRHTALPLAAAGTRILALLGLAAITTMVASCVGGRSSGIGDLSTAALHRDDVPPGYTKRGYKLFNTYAKVMLLKGAPPQANCPAGSVTASTWQQGMIVVFSRGPLHFILECGWLLKSDSDAHTAYHADAQRGERNSPVRFKPLSASQIGAESTALRTAVPGVTAYGILFRRQNAVIGIDYIDLGTPDLSSARFLSLAKSVNARLK